MALGSLSRYGRPDIYSNVHACRAQAACGRLSHLSHQTAASLGLALLANLNVDGRAESNAPDMRGQRLHPPAFPTTTASDH